MKKRLLITSIVMMLVVAVALSTATYAWFTSNNSVTATDIKMVAAVSDASALGIGWIGASAYQGASNLITSDAAGTYRPMVPQELEANSTESTVVWNSATIKSVDGTLVFNDDIRTSEGQTADTLVAPYTFSGTISDTTYSAFYVKNLSNANDIANLRMTLNWNANDTYTAATGLTSEVTAEANQYYTEADGVYTAVPANTTYSSGTWYTKDTKNDSLVRVAVFSKAAAVKSAPDATAYVLKGVLANEANLNTEWGEIEEGDPVADLCATNAEVKTVTQIDFGTLEKNKQIDLVVIVWLDGVALNDDTAGSVSYFGLNFAATAAVNG